MTRSAFPKPACLYGIVLMGVSALVSSSCTGVERIQEIWRPVNRRPDVVRVTAWALLENEVQPEPEESRKPPTLSALEEKTFEAEATGYYPADASGQVQRLVVARTEARRSALRNVADEILGYRLDAGRTIAQAAGDGADLNSKMTAFLESSAEVEFLEEEENVIAKVRVRGSAVAEAFGLTPRPRPPNDEESQAEATPPPLTFEQRREKARVAALEKARARLYELLLETRTDAGPLRRLLVDDPGLDEKLHSIIAELEPEAVEYTQDNACEVTISLDRNIIRDWIGQPAS